MQLLLIFPFFKHFSILIQIDITLLVQDGACPRQMTPFLKLFVANIVIFRSEYFYIKHIEIQTDHDQRQTTLSAWTDMVYHPQVAKKGHVLRLKIDLARWLHSAAIRISYQRPKNCDVEWQHTCFIDLKDKFTRCLHGPTPGPGRLTSLPCEIAAAWSRS